MKMEIFEQTEIWNQTLAPQRETPSRKDDWKEHRARFRTSFMMFREFVSTLAAEIPQGIRELTVHDITHIDALWQIADIIVGDDFVLTPPEAFVLGGSFLLHDLGMAIATYPHGAEDLKATVEWQDAISQIARRADERPNIMKDSACMRRTLEQEAMEQVLRLRHAKQALDLCQMPFQHSERDQTYYLLADAELRANYGPLIGEIAYSHWWSIEKVRQRFEQKIGSPPGCPVEWSVDPLKLACLIRVADACHLDSRRAPGFLRSLRKPSGHAETHWRFQEFLQTPFLENNRLVFTSSKPFTSADCKAWWLCYEMLHNADKELRDVCSTLQEMNRSPFRAQGILNADEPKRLTRHIRTRGWTPVDASLRVSDVAALVRKLGGEDLYGNNPIVPLRELIQNARDAIIARRFLERRNDDWGEITVRLGQDDDTDWIEVDDNGIGMSEEVLCGPFLDFGKTYWGSELQMRERPGLLANGFESNGQYGIGFFSSFMWGDRIRIITRCPDDGTFATRVLEFEDGLSQRPLLREASVDERRNDPGTCVRVWLRSNAKETGGPLGPGYYHWDGYNGPGPLHYGSYYRRTPWSLAALCAWVSPAIDVNVLAEEDGNSQIALRTSDWLEMQGGDFFHRLIQGDEDLRTKLSNEFINLLGENLRLLKDHNGVPVGRACIGVSLGRLAQHLGYTPGVLTAGVFRASEIAPISGLLLGRSSRATRDEAIPLVGEKELACWATDQADLVTSLSNHPDELMYFASAIRMCNGETKQLPIGKTSSGPVSFSELVDWADQHDEIFIFNIESFDYECKNRAELKLRMNGILSSVGYFGVSFLEEEDPEERADHDYWEMHWRSLSGAVAEAISMAWKVPLQELLDGSETQPSDMDNEILVVMASDEIGVVEEVYEIIYRRPISNDEKAAG